MPVNEFNEQNPRIAVHDTASNKACCAHLWPIALVGQRWHRQSVSDGAFDVRRWKYRGLERT